MIKIGLHGATGRMGREVIGLIPEYPDCALVYRYSRGASLDDLCDASDIVIDFSSPEGLPALIECAISHRVPLLIGTTGMSSDLQKNISAAAKQIPILQAPNTSLGVNLLSNFAAIASKALDGYDIEIIEMHHAHKKDAPSGTALMLKKEMNKTVRFSSIRAGNLSGEHQVMFVGQNEVVTLTHRALDRKCYAEGAIEAAMWLKDMSAGLYGMKDVLDGAARKN